MKWINASIKPPTGSADEYSWRCAKDKKKFNPMLNINGNILEYEWLRSEFSFDEVEYLDESTDLPTTEALEREAANLYPLEDKMYKALNNIRMQQRAAYITCAKQYISRCAEMAELLMDKDGEIEALKNGVEGLRKENEALKAIAELAWYDAIDYDTRRISDSDKPKLWEKFKKDHGIL